MSTLRTYLTSAVLSLALTMPALAPADEKLAAATTPAADASLDGVLLKGTILETMNSSGYTYLLLDAAQGKIWVAISETKVKAGQAVSCMPGMTMFDFSSKTLNRTFERIVFSPGLDKGETAASDQPGAAKPAKEGAGFDAALKAEGAAGAKGSMPAGGTEIGGMTTGSVGAVVPSAEINVNKATGPNSYSVGECFEQGKELNGKAVRVRGKVMKISRMIMGKNWVHIQDGTGNPLKNQHDLVATTSAEPAEGSVVTIAGTLAAERDFGAGYKYEVIVENATIEP